MRSPLVIALGLLVLVSSGVGVAAAARADGGWTVSPTSLAFGKIKATQPGAAGTNAELSFTITDADPKVNVLVLIDRTSPPSNVIILEGPSNNPAQAICTTTVFAGTSCTQKVILHTDAPGHIAKLSVRFTPMRSPWINWNNVPFSV